MASPEATQTNSFDPAAFYGDLRRSSEIFPRYWEETQRARWARIVMARSIATDGSSYSSTGPVIATALHNAPPEDRSVAITGGGGSFKGRREVR